MSLSKLENIGSKIKEPWILEQVEGHFIFGDYKNKRTLLTLLICYFILLYVVFLNKSFPDLTAAVLSEEDYCGNILEQQEFKHSTMVHIAGHFVVIFPYITFGRSN